MPNIFSELRPEILGHFAGKLLDFIISDITDNVYYKTWRAEHKLAKNQSDFLDRYAEAVVVLKKSSKPEPLLRFFAEQEVINTFYAQWQGGAEADFLSGFGRWVYHFTLESQIQNFDSREEANFFLNALKKAVHENQSASEAEMRVMLERIEQLLRSSSPIPKAPFRTPHPKIQVSELPTLQPDFTGREKELARLDAAWADPNANIVQFIAPGGTGKTMLVTYWLEKRIPKDTAEVIYAWSFYNQGSDDSKQSSSDLFFKRAMDFLEEKEMPTDPSERGRALANALRRHRCLLILDGIEPLQHPPGPFEGELKDPALKALFRELSFEQPGLCILTTRISVKELEGKGEPQHLRCDLEDLGEIAGAALLRNIGVKGNEKDLRAAALEYRGHAFALRLLGNYLTDLLDGDVRQRNRIPHLTDDVRDGRHARRMMEAYVIWFTTQNPGAKLGPELMLLHILGLFDRPAPVEAMDALAAEPDIPGLTDGLRKMESVRLKRAINHLKKLGLLIEIEPLDGALPKDLHYLTLLHYLESAEIGSPAADSARWQNLTLDPETTAESRLLVHNLDLLNIQRKSAIAEALPSLSAFATISAQGFRPDINFFDTDRRWYGAAGAGVRLKIPIFDGFRVFNKAWVYKLEAQKLEEDRRQLNAGKTLEFRQAREQLGTSLATLRSQSDNVALAREITDKLVLQYKEGVASLTDLLNAQTALSEAETNYWQQVFSYKLAVLKLLKTAGQLELLKN